jgi:hypothetical protein
MKINLLPTLILLLAFTACSKEQKKKGENDPILGTWNYNGNKIVINNTVGEPDPYTVTVISDSLIIAYPPSVNLRYKLLYVNDTKMAVTSNDSLFVYKKE